MFKNINDKKGKGWKKKVKVRKRLIRKGDNNKKKSHKDKPFFF
jgi:hypothetical protein